jgi:hypothetical protein
VIAVSIHRKYQNQKRGHMKRIMLVGLFALVMGWASVSKASTERERYYAYMVACLEQLQDGGTFVGSVYESNPWDDGSQERKKFQFGEYFQDGQARALISCTPGWYRGWASWKNSNFNEALFYSQYQNPTQIGAGLQAMPFIMTLNEYRSVRLDFKGALLSDSDEIWFNGVRAWRDENGVWRAGVNKPWNVIGTEAEVIWIGHGGWRLQVTQETFGGVISLNTQDLDDGMMSPTKLKAISFLGDGAYLQEDLVKYTGRYWNEEFGCEVLEIESLFDRDIKEFTLVLNGLEQYSGKRVNYFTASVENVGGVFLIPIGNISVMPETQMMVYFTDPRTGQTVYCWLDSSDLWYPSTGGKG